MGRLSSFFRNPFSFLSSTKGSDDRIAAYVIREHDRGRSLDDILDDPYVVNRCTEAEIKRILERPEVVKAFGDDIAAHTTAGQSSS